MSISVRFYLFADDGLQRISQRVMDGIARGTDSMPQFSGTKQKVADVIVELEDGKPARIASAEGHYLTFDSKGKADKALQAVGFAAMDNLPSMAEARRKPGSTKVVDLSSKLKRDKWTRENRWTLSKQDLDAIADDIWGRKQASAPKVQQAKGTSPKPPPLTYEAKEALVDIQVKVSTIMGRLEDLTEPALKGIAFEARRLAETELGASVWRGVAEAADLRREIQSRYRTGKGVWYACVDLIQWDEFRRTGHTTTSFHEKCNSKAEAEAAARRLLVENSQYFRSSLSIEASVVCDLEWLDPEGHESAIAEEDGTEAGTALDPAIDTPNKTPKR